MLQPQEAKGLLHGSGINYSILIDKESKLFLVQGFWSKEKEAERKAWVSEICTSISISKTSFSVKSGVEKWQKKIISR